MALLFFILIVASLRKDKKNTISRHTSDKWREIKNNFHRHVAPFALTLAADRTSKGVLVCWVMMWGDHKHRADRVEEDDSALRHPRNGMPKLKT